MSSIWAKGCIFDDCVCYLTSHDYPSLVKGENHGILFIEYQIFISRFYPSGVAS